MNWPAPPDPNTVVLPGECVIEYADELKNGLMNALDEKSVDVIDLSRVERVDLSGIQILVSALATASGAGHDFHIVGNPAAAVDEMMSLSGYRSYIDGFRS